MKLSNGQKRLFLVVFTVLIPLVVAEIVLRITEYGSKAFWQPDPIYGKALIGGGEAWYTNEGRAFVRINNQGYHDKNHQVNKPENVFRIAVLGDSFVEALQVPYQKSFWFLLAEKLKTCTTLSDKTIETLGFGVSNYGTGHELLMLRNEVVQYHPDEVILSFFQGNDITDNSSYYYSGPSPLFSVQNNQLVVGNQFVDEPGFKKRIWLAKFGYYRLMLEFRVLELIRNSIKLLPQIFTAKKHPPVQRQNDGLVDLAQRQKHEQELENSWMLTQKLIKLFQNETLKANAGFTVLSIPHSSLLLPERDKVQNSRHLSRQEYYQQINKNFLQFTGKENISTVSLANELRPYTENYLYGFKNNKLGRGHFSEYGHEKVSEILAKHLCSKISAS